MPYCTPYSLISANTTNATPVVAGSGVLESIQVFNVGSALAYLKVYDKATAPDPSTDTPIKRWAIPHNSGGGAGAIASNLGGGLEFTNGLAFLLVTGIADTNETAVPANEILVNFDYRT